MTSCGEYKTPSGDGKISTFFSKSAKLLQIGFATVIGILQRRINPSATSKFDQLSIWSTKIRQVAISAQQALWHFSKLRHPYMIIGNNQPIFSRFLPFLMLCSLHRTPISIMMMPVTNSPLCQIFLSPLLHQA